VGVTSLDMKSRRFPDSESLSVALERELLDFFVSEGASPRAVMLAGGRTPLEAYRRVAAAGTRAAPGRRSFFSDERMVPFDSPDNNFSQGVPMLDSLGVHSEDRLRVQTNLALEEAADRYERDLRNWIAAEVVFELGILGLGADGHTASIFSDRDLEAARNRIAFGVPKEPGPDRVSVGVPLLQCIQRVILVVAGAEKAEIANRILMAPQEVIAGRALAAHSNVELWTA